MSVTEQPAQDWQRVIDINLSGAFFMAQAALEHMLTRGTGRIINVSSVIEETGNVGQANYAASKSGLFGLTKTLARETLFHLNEAQLPPGDGIRLTVNAVTHIRPDVSPADLARLRSAFAGDGAVTAGNASGINDAAAAVVLAARSAAEARGLTALGRLIGYAHAGVEPRIMGMGPVPAVHQVLDRTGIKIDEIDVFEVNEAFAAQALAVARELGLPPERTNPNGSGVGLGHPVGATGAILAVKALYELRRTGGRYALVTMCIGGGQGIAAIFERA
jgi:acetyl-CoA acetyltransferase family protein